jgi:hypothetical protein
LPKILPALLSIAAFFRNQLKHKNEMIKIRDNANLEISNSLKNKDHEILLLRRSNDE